MSVCGTCAATMTLNNLISEYHVCLPKSSMTVVLCATEAGLWAWQPLVHSRISADISKKFALCWTAVTVKLSSWVCDWAGLFYRMTATHPIFVGPVSHAWRTSHLASKIKEIFLFKKAPNSWGLEHSYTYSEKRHRLARAANSYGL